MIVLETERLTLRRLSADDDGPFVLELVNDPDWLRFIGDKGVRSLEDARTYILKGPVDMYERLGFGMYLTELKSDRTPIGICGLIKRDSLEDVDLGFAFLPTYRSRGYAYEAASAVVSYGQRAFSLKRLVAITSPDNEASARLLGKLGFVFKKPLALSGGADVVNLFSLSALP